MTHFVEKYSAQATSQTHNLPRHFCLKLCFYASFRGSKAKSIVIIFTIMFLFLSKLTMFFFFTNLLIFVCALKPNNF